MKFIILIIFLFLVSFVNAETTFFDNPDETIIVYSPTLPKIIAQDTLTGQGRLTGDCVYRWNCTKWEICVSSGKQNRYCINTGTCPDNYKPPKTEQNCSSSDITGEIILKEVGENKIVVYFAIVLLIGLVIFFLKRYYSFRHKRI